MFIHICPYTDTRSELNKFHKIWYRILIVLDCNLSVGWEYAHMHSVNWWRVSSPTTLPALLVSMAIKHNNVLLNLITGCLYWLTCFGQLCDHHQVYKS